MQCSEWRSGCSIEPRRCVSFAAFSSGTCSLAHQSELKTFWWALPCPYLAAMTLLLQFERGTFQNENVSSIRCRVAAIEGGWVKCGSADGFGVDRTQKWMNLEYVIQVTKYEK